MDGGLLLRSTINCNAACAYPPLMGLFSHAQMVEMLKRQLGDKLKEMEAFKAKYGVQSEKGGGADAPAAAAAAPAKTNHGVLV